MTQEELKDKIKALHEEMKAHGYHHLIVAGKEGTCSR